MDHLADQRGRTSTSVEQIVNPAVRRRLQEYPHAFVFRSVAWQFDNGRLTLRGRVPSFYLKQVLQELLRGVEGVDRIENDVDVVNSNGLSSVRPNKPRQ